MNQKSVAGVYIQDFVGGCMKAILAGLAIVGLVAVLDDADYKMSVTVGGMH